MLRYVRCARDGSDSFQVKREQNLNTNSISEESPTMATVVPCASCYGNTRVGFFGRGHGGGYMPLLGTHGPRGAPPPTLARHAPNMTLRQICHMLRLMRKIRRREAATAAAATATRKQTAGLPTPNSPSQKRCLPGFLRRRRTNNIKRVS